MAGMEEFIDDLPPHLRMAVQIAIHKRTFKFHPLFARMQLNKRLLGWIGSRFRPWFNHAGTFLYKQGDDIN
jgi:hypothetical protein